MGTMSTLSGLAGIGINLRMKKTGDSLEYLNKLIQDDFIIRMLDKYGKQGVEALAAATPKDTGLTAASWTYDIDVTEDGKYKLSFINLNINDGFPVALLIQYGHATRNGSWVEGRDYINPALQPIFNQIRDSVWKEMIDL